jgi:hypothetical protein
MTRRKRHGNFVWVACINVGIRRAAPVTQYGCREEGGDDEEKENDCGSQSGAIPLHHEWRPVDSRNMCAAQCEPRRRTRGFDSAFRKWILLWRTLQQIVPTYPLEIEPAKRPVTWQSEASTSTLTASGSSEGSPPVSRSSVGRDNEKNSRRHTYPNSTQSNQRNKKSQTKSISWNTIWCCTSRGYQ